jgi:hypothetical protein
MYRGTRPTATRGRRFIPFRIRRNQSIPRETSRIASCDLRISTMGYSNGWDGMSQDSRVKLRELYFC